MNSGFLAANIETEGFYTQQFMVFSSCTLATGFLFLLVVIKTVDSAARNIPMPILDVMFTNRSNKITIKPNQTTKTALLISNNGEEIAEDIEAYLIIPTSLAITPMGDQTVKKYGANDPLFQNCTIVTFTAQKFLYEDSTYSEPIMITAPDEKRIYEITAFLYERRTERKEQKLTIEVEK